jgi:hypothetical protein
MKPPLYTFKLIFHHCSRSGAAVVIGWDFVPDGN